MRTTPQRYAKASSLCAKSLTAAALQAYSNPTYIREHASLSLLDEVILLDIYPARELPIEGVSSKLIYDHLRADMQKHLCDKSALLPLLRQEETDVVMVLGAGDVDAMVPQIAQMLKEKYNII